MTYSEEVEMGMSERFVRALLAVDVRSMRHPPSHADPPM